MCKFLGTVLLVAIFIASGVSKIQNPEPIGQVIKNSANIQLAVQTAGYTPKAEEYTLAAKAIGGIEVAAAVLLVFGLCGCLPILTLVIFTIGATITVHIPDIKNPAGVLANKEDVINCLKNLSIIGGLFLACSGAAAGGCCGKTCGTAAPKKAANLAKKKQ